MTAVMEDETDISAALDADVTHVRFRVCLSVYDVRIRKDCMNSCTVCLSWTGQALFISFASQYIKQEGLSTDETLLTGLRSVLSRALQSAL